MACQKYANKVGMMHESKGRKAPSLHLFHIAVRQHALRAESAPSMQLLVLCISICILHTDYYDQSAAHSSSVYRGVYNGATFTTSSMLAIKLLGSYLITILTRHTYVYN